MIIKTDHFWYHWINVTVREFSNIIFDLRPNSVDDVVGKYENVWQNLPIEEEICGDMVTDDMNDQHLLCAQVVVYKVVKSHQKRKYLVYVWRNEQMRDEKWEMKDDVWEKRCERWELRVDIFERWVLRG